jgi:hypothetical protein
MHSKKSLLSFGLVLASFAVTPLATLAQGSGKFPTSAEMQRLRQDFQRVIRSHQSNPQSRVYIQDRRSQSEKQSRESFVRAWSQTEPQLAPFLGNWSGYEENIEIYPSRTKGRVCIVTTGEGYGSLSLAFFSNGAIHDNKGAVIFKDRNYLAFARLQNGKFQVFDNTPLNSPMPLQSIEKLGEYILDLKQRNLVFQQFRNASCTTSRP